MIYLSPPDVGELDRRSLLDAFDSGWIAPVGPAVDGFEADFRHLLGPGFHAAALSSGTAALHLALTLVGVGPGDEVFVSDLTFAATANAVRYCGAEPVFIDSERTTWNMDPVLLSDELERRAATGRLPAAVVVVDIYGQCADYARIEPVCERFGVPLVEDAAEALGASYQGRAAGTFGVLSAFSFNGNKIITTSGGGMLCGSDETLVDRARFLASQAREPHPHYEHEVVGFNYRLSNLLAALGRAQLSTLPRRVQARRAIKARYREALADLPGVQFMPDDAQGVATNWLSVLTIDPVASGVTTDEVRLALAAADIECRPAWKPMHLQPVFARNAVVGGEVAAEIFATGLCLPSGSNLSQSDQWRVVEGVHAAFGAGRGAVAGGVSSEQWSRR